MSLTDVLLKKKVLPLFFQKHRISIILIVLELRSRMTLTEKNILGVRFKLFSSFTRGGVTVCNFHFDCAHLCRLFFFLNESL